MRWTLPFPDDFDFVSAVCSHGFFVLAPNRWDGEQRVLRTVISVDRGGAYDVELSADDATVRVDVPRVRRLPNATRSCITDAVGRILRLDEDLTAFHTQCAKYASHRVAARRRFGRLLRSATLFEDIVKIICTCNVTWKQTTGMVDALVRHYGTPAGNHTDVHAFPTAEQLAGVPENELKATARVGYRAVSISRLARSVQDGTIDLTAFEDPDRETTELFKNLKRKLHGVGDYAAGNLCMLLGRYDRLAADTEMLRFWKTHYPRRHHTVRAIEAHYRTWQPYAFLAYWWELWNDYTESHGDAADWQRDEQGTAITSQPR